MALSSRSKLAVARLLVLAVLVSNLYCAFSFIANPGAYTDAYQLAGEGAQAAIAGLGVAFCMWNVTYLPVIAFPDRFPVLFSVVLAQQLVGLVGETFIYRSLGLTQAIVASSIMRFIIFDAIGLVLLVVAFVLSRRAA